MENNSDKLKNNIDDLYIYVNDTIIKLNYLLYDMNKIKSKIFYLLNPCNHNWTIDHSVISERCCYICNKCGEQK
jgi:hypothetical protein